MKKLIIAALALGSLGAFAQSTSSSTSSNTVTGTLGNAYNKLKESPLKLSLINEWSPARDEEKNLTANGWSNAFYTYFTYKLNARNKITAYPTWVTTRDAATKTSDTVLSNVTVDFAHTGVMRQDKYGFDLGFVARSRTFADNIKKNKASNGYARVGARVGRKFTDTLSASADILVAQYLQDSSVATETTADNYFYIPASATLTLGEKGYVAVIPEYFRTFATDNAGETETLDLGVEGGYELLPGVSSALSIYSRALMQSNDGKTFKDEIAQSLEYTLLLSMSVF
jgi:hypothetical protein